ncbi:hypothetical protein SAMN05216516_102253 [Izhakiella capsodis]|uniref:Uncharacterized protein n=1 Tax=Izhakiella capsodis TaxID=1367852 RepID=A0A1I4W3B9_9GAMM|nr:hypothetical protein SAMN05216516_102253 [Izhakiella capsodis]
MPLQAVTLEPLVQGECVVVAIRLPGLTGHAHKPRSATFCAVEISAQGTGPLANISEKVDNTVTVLQWTMPCYSKFAPWR